jgi:hypothetical protein
MIRGTEALARIIQRHCWPEEDDSRDRSPLNTSSEKMKLPREQCTWAMQKEQENFEENSIPKSVWVTFEI